MDLHKQCSGVNQWDLEDSLPRSRRWLKRLANRTSRHNLRALNKDTQMSESPEEVFWDIEQLALKEESEAIWYRCTIMPYGFRLAQRAW